MSTRTGLLAIVAVAALAACSNGAPTASESVPSAEHSHAHSEGDHDHSDTPSAAAAQVTGPVKVVTALLIANHLQSTCKKSATPSKRLGLPLSLPNLRTPKPLPKASPRMFRWR